VAAILGQSEAALTVGSVDLFLESVNNVRKNAQMVHNFEYTRMRATLDINGETGGSLEDAVFANGRTVVVTDNTYTTDNLESPWILVSAEEGRESTPIWCCPNIQGIDFIPVFLTWTNSEWVIAKPTDFSYVFSGPTTRANPSGVYAGTGTVVGESLTVTVAYSDVPFTSVKEVVAVTTTRADGTDVPLDFTNPAVSVERDRYSSELTDYYTQEERYPSDAQIMSRGVSAAVIQRGRTLYLYPTDTITAEPLAVNLEGYGWLRDYTDADLNATTPTDFFIEHGFSFLQWAVVCELNYVFQKFVPRQEGVISAPEKARDDAWRVLLLWDTYQVDSNMTRSR